MNNFDNDITTYYNSETKNKFFIPESLKDTMRVSIPIIDITRTHFIRKRNHEVVYMDGYKFIIGRNNDEADLLINDNKMISHRHALIEKKGKRYYITDLGSKNGTYINNKQLKKGKRVLLSDNSVIYLSRGMDVEEIEVFFAQDNK